MEADTENSILRSLVKKYHDCAEYDMALYYSEELVHGIRFLRL